MAGLEALCAGRAGLLAHLYWTRNISYFAANRDSFLRKGDWCITATPGHGVGRPIRPTVNFFVADLAFAQAYRRAALSRGIHHGVLVTRALIEGLAEAPGFEMAEVQVGHPAAHGSVDERDGWRFDIGQHRFRAVAELSRNTVLRLATPNAPTARQVRVPSNAVVAWW